MAEISGTLCEENEIASDNYYQDYKTPQMTNTFCQCLMDCTHP